MNGRLDDTKTKTKTGKQKNSLLDRRISSWIFVRPATWRDSITWNYATNYPRRPRNGTSSYRRPVSPDTLPGIDPTIELNCRYLRPRQIPDYFLSYRRPIRVHPSILIRPLDRVQSLYVYDVGCLDVTRIDLCKVDRRYVRQLPARIRRSVPIRISRTILRRRPSRGYERYTVTAKRRIYSNVPVARSVSMAVTYVWAAVVRNPLIWHPYVADVADNDRTLRIRSVAFLCNRWTILLS